MTPPPLIPGSPLARAAFALMSGEPVVELPADLDELATIEMCGVVEYVRSVSRQSFVYLVPKPGHREPAVQHLRTIFSAWRSRISVGTGADLTGAGLAVSSLESTYDVKQADVVVVDPLYPWGSPPIPQLFSPFGHVWFNQVLAVRPLPDHLRSRLLRKVTERVTWEVRTARWGDIPAELVLAGAS